MKIFTRPTLWMLAVLTGIAMPTAAFAQTHLDNPFVGATVYKNPDYAAKVQTSIAQTTDSALVAKMRIVAQTPTFVWLDRMAAIPSTASQTGLAAHLDNALAQQTAGTPIVAEFVVYDMPGRDCAALASNGEIPLTADGLNTYKTQYIDVIAGILSQPKYAGIRIVTVVEPDSLPNLVTNLNLTACANANSTGIYAAATQYALNKLHAIPNVYTYMDIGHSGWLGWPSNAGPAVQLFTQIVNGTTAKLASVDGFVTDTANDIPLKEPFMTGTQTVGGQQLISATFYSFDPDIDEASYTADLWQRFTQAGWPTTLGMLIDTSRNGWGGPGRPTAASTSTVVSDFVTASKIDKREHRGLWCNQNGAGLGEPPVATPSGFAASHLDAFVWVKPPGDSDGASMLIPNDEGKGFDRMCDPTFRNPSTNNVLTNALPDAPLSGHWFHAQFVQLVQNANPPVGNAPPPPTCSTLPTAPASFTATAVSSTQINLAWTAVAPGTNCSVTYTLHRSTTSNFTPSAATQIATGLTATTFNDPGRLASTTYFYIIQVVEGSGTATARAQATTPATGPGTCNTAPATVSGLTATANSSSQITLQWGAVTPPTNCAVTYSVHRSTTSGFTPSPTTLIQSAVTATTSVQIGLTAGTTYFFAVIADDAAGSSAATRAQATTGNGTGTGTCHVGFTVTNSWNTGFQASLSIQNTSTAPLSGWTLTWTFPGGQTVSQLWNGAATQTGTGVSVTNLTYNANIAAGASYNDAGFTANGTAATPTNFAINGVACQ